VRGAVLYMCIEVVGDFGNLATPSMKHFIFRHHFKELNFAYIFHKASRPVRLKETTRQNLRLRIDFITATMLLLASASRHHGPLSPPGSLVTGGTLPLSQLTANATELGLILSNLILHQQIQQSMVESVIFL
jgi:hypothetical protein